MANGSAVSVDVIPPAQPHRPTPDPFAAAAIDLARRGFRIIPIKPGSKVPPLRGWGEAATNNVETVRSWWEGLYRGHGIGIRTGWTGSIPVCIFVLDVDGPSHGVDGEAILADIIADHEPLPDTVEAITGSGGRHLYFWTRQLVTNAAGATLAKRVGAGIDIRGEGGQVLAPPTVHPNGMAYAWVDGHAPSDRPLAEAPAWLIELITDRPASPSTRATTAARGDRPGDRWSASITWAELLGRHGWVHHHRDRDGEDHWTRPGKDRREGTSATTGYRGSDVLKVFTSSIPELEAERTYTKLGFLAAMEHGGDIRAAVDRLRREGWGNEGGSFTEVDASAFAMPMSETNIGPTTWEPVDLAPFLDGTWNPPTPTIIKCGPSSSLMYAGKINALIGESGCGKSWLAMHACAERIRQNETVIYIDMEDHAGSVSSRMIALGISPNELIDRFIYVHPDAAYGPVAATLVESLVAERGVTLAVIDSTGESMALEGVVANHDEEVAAWFRRIPRSLAGLGCGVILLDHVVKDPGARGLYASGSQRKRAAIDGAAFLVDAAVPPSRTTEGHLRLTCAKDRHGTFRAGQVVAEVILGVDDGAGKIRVRPATGSHRPTVLMERVSIFVELHPGSTTREIRNGVKGRSEHVANALKVLVDEGWVRQDVGARRAAVYHSVRAFRQEECHGE